MLLEGPAHDRDSSAADPIEIIQPASVSASSAGGGYPVNSFQLDDQPVGGSIKRQLQIRNTTDGTWKISEINVGCSCTEVVLDRHEVPPGGTLNALTAINVPQSAGHFETSFDLGDETSTLCSARIGMEVFRRLAADTEIIDFGKFYSAGSRTVSFECSVSEGAVPPENIVVRAIGDSVAVEVQELEANKSWKIAATVAVKGDLTPRAVQGDLQIQCAEDGSSLGAGDSLFVPYRYEITSGMKCSPTVLLLTSPNQSATAFLFVEESVLSGPTVDGDDLIQVDCDTDACSVTLSRVNERVWKVLATRNGDADLGDAVRIPVTFRVDKADGERATCQLMLRLPNREGNERHGE